MLVLDDRMHNILYDYMICYRLLEEGATLNVSGARCSSRSSSGSSRVCELVAAARYRVVEGFQLL